MKKLLFLSTSILLLSACGNSVDTEDEEANEDQSVDETEEPQSDEDLPENNEDSESESTENDRDDSKLTEEEAEARVVNYREEQENRDSEFYEFGMEEEGEIYTASMHAPISTDERKGAPILARYEINRTTGEVQEIDMSPEEPEPHLSEIVLMSEEERREHHRELAADEENLVDSVLDNIMLPGLHENTMTYEGRVNPDNTIELSLTTADDPPYSEELNISPDIDNEGYFTINLRPYDLGNKSILRF